MIKHLLIAFFISFSCIHVYSQENEFEKSSIVSIQSDWDFNFVNIDARSAFKAVAAAGTVDIVLSPNVTGRITLSLTRKTWEEALLILSEMLNLEYTKKKNYYYVQTMEDLQQQQEKTGLTRAIIQLKHSKVSDLQEPIQGLLSARGKVTVVQRSNSLIVVDIPTKVDEIIKSVNILDVESFQVHIQAQIIEVSSQYAQELGINWGALNDANYSAQGGVPGGTTVEGVVGGSTPGRVTGPSASLDFSVFKGRLAGVLEQLLTEGKGEIVAKPQITTLDNIQAKIFIGQRIPFLKLDKDLNTVTEFISAGIELTVTPHITNDNRVILDLSPRRSDVSSFAASGDPIITTQEATTTVIVNDGQTVVIGGLTQNTKSKTEQGLPFLKDIPLLGYLFKYTKEDIKKIDLVIFITPYIVRGDNVPVPSLGKVDSENLNQLFSGQNENGGSYNVKKSKKVDDTEVKNFLDELGK